jgi:hypothetical protein
MQQDAVSLRYGRAIPYNERLLGIEHAAVFFGVAFSDHLHEFSRQRALSRLHALEHASTSEGPVHIFATI